eukprot:scaffold2340_cov185-Ochromonas_danica.AAC.3
MGATGSYTAKATIHPLLYPFTKWGSKEIALFLQRGLVNLPETFALRRHEFTFLLTSSKDGSTTTTTTGGGLGGTEEQGGGQGGAGGTTTTTELTFPVLRALFQEIFDTDGNGLVDKYEVISIILLTSKISSLEKVESFFTLFNFNNKGYLNPSELTLLFLAVTRGAYKIDQKFLPPTLKVIKGLVSKAFLHYATHDNTTNEGQKEQEQEEEGKSGHGKGNNNEGSSHTYGNVSSHGSGKQGSGQGSAKGSSGYGSKGEKKLRKPQLLSFIQDEVDITAFLECWRGHASQVLLPPGMKWKDLSFPCHYQSICLSPNWQRIGLPPSDFIHWRRRDKGKDIYVKDILLINGY